MFKLTEKQALYFTVLLFAGTILLNFLLPTYTITSSGLLLSIFVSIFVPGRAFTIVLGILCAVAVLISAIIFTDDYSSTPFITYTLFRLFLVAFATIVSLYVKRLYANFQHGKTHMDSLFENATEGIILTDKHGKIVLVNPAAEKMFGYSSNELIGEAIEILIPARHRVSHVKLREGFHSDPQNRVMGHGRDLHGTKKDGTDFPVEVSLSHYKQNGNSFAIAFIIDITRRKMAETDMINQKAALEKVTADIRKLNTDLEAKVEERTLILKEALNKLELSQTELSDALDKERELNEIKSRFVSMASHEFRTPLSTVLSSASLLSKYTTTEDQEKRDKHIFRIKDSVKQLNDILEDFLSLGKLDEGKVHATPTDFDLHELVKDVVEEMTGLIKRNQQIKYEHEGSGSAFTDKKLIRNILVNLISNAIKFSPEGGCIIVRSIVNGDVAQVAIKDNGIGISKDDLEHLFSSFFRGANATNIQGTGLGLHIVKRYANLLSGDVTLRSELNRGTIVTVTFPVNYNSIS